MRYHFGEFARRWSIPWRTSRSRSIQPVCNSVQKNCMWQPQIKEYKISMGLWCLCNTTRNIYRVIRTCNFNHIPWYWTSVHSGFWFHFQNRQGRDDSVCKYSPHESNIPNDCLAGEELRVEPFVQTPYNNYRVVTRGPRTIRSQIVCRMK